MYTQKNTPATKLSRVAVAVISINTAIISSSTFAEDTTSLPTLIVTGEKVDKDIKDTTTAVTIYDEESYSNGAIRDVNDIATQAPNVVSAGFGSVNIRGTSGNGAATGGYALLTGSRSRVSTVIDGTTQDWTGYNFTPSGVWDTQQVEVLRGPQSTTQGTSSMAGAIAIKTNDPTFYPESKIRVGIESYENGNLKGNVAVMNSGSINEELAYRIAIDKTQGEGWITYEQTDTELDESQDLNDSDNLNVRAKLLWKPSEKLNVKTTIEHHTYEGEYAQWVSNADTYTQTLDSDNYVNVRLQDSSTSTVATDIDYDLTETLKNALHISYSESDIHFDEYTGGTEVDADKETIALENRLLFNDKNSDVSGVIGAYVSSKDNNIDVVDRVYNIGTTDTAAIYGDSTYVINSKTNLITGLRVEYQNVERVTGYYSSGNEIEQDFNETYILPKLGVTYDLTEATTLNVSVRKGYSPGGTAYTWDSNQDLYTFDNEEVITYEAGSKTRLENGLMLNTTVFYNDYTDYQAFIDATYIDNIDAAHTIGLEVEATGWVTESLELRASLGLLKSEVDNYDSYEGNELPAAPSTNLSIGFTQYVSNNISFGADATYVGEYYSDLDNTEDYKAGGFTTFDANIDYEIGDLLISGYMKNITNESLVYIQNSDGERSYIGQSRTIGVSATYRM
jgi:outer membrane receptor protein involved in Fe transport